MEPLRQPRYEADLADDILGGGGSGSSDTGTKVLPEVYDDPVSGLRYQLDTNGRRVYLPAAPKPASTSVTVQNTPIQNQAGRYVTRVDETGAITGFPGAVYQEDTYDGSITIVKKPTASTADPRDKDSNGIDDSSGMALGVYRDANSPTGFSYGTGQPVYPNGAPYQDDGSQAPDLVNGKWVWDPAQKKYVIAPGMETTGTTTTAGMTGSTSGFNAIKAAAGGGYGSSGGSAASTRDYIGEIQAKSDAEAAYLDKKFALEKEMLLLEQAFKNDPNNPDYVLRRQALMAQVAQNEQQNKLEALKAFETAVSSPDMAKLGARRLALGGDATTASLLQDGGNFRENSAAAELLAMIRGMGSNNALGQVAANAVGAANPATQQAANTPMPMTPLPAAGGTGAPATPATPAPIPEPQGTFDQRLNQQLTADTSWARRADEKYAAEMRARMDPTQWKPVGNGQVYQHALTGEKITAQEYAQLVTYIRDSTTAGPVNAAGGIMAGTGGLGDYYVRPVSANQGDGNLNIFGQPTSPLDPLGQMTGTSSQNFSPDWINYQAPSTKAQSGAENLTTIGRLIETDAAPVVGGAGGPNPAEEPIGNRAVLPMVAYGSVMPMRGSAIAGDPQADGRPNPEVVHWTPQGNVFMPMKSLPPQTQAMAMRAMPKFAYGSYADVESALSGGITGAGVDYSAYQPKRTTSRISYTDQAAQPAPAPAPVVQPAPVAPAPAPMPMQPIPTAPVATAPVATQPAPVAQPAPQPAPTATTTAPAPAPAPQTVQTVGSGSVPTSPTSDPLNPTALSPAALAMLGEIDDFRQDQPLADVNTLDSAFLRAAPSFQTGVLAAKQTKYGIPVDDWANEIARFQLRGRPTMTAVGY
jgi:hypothetical protein